MYVLLFGKGAVRQVVKVQGRQGARSSRCKVVKVQAVKMQAVKMQAVKVQARRNGAA